MTNPPLSDRPPVTAAADLTHLHPGRLRRGGTGVFAGDWSFDGTGRPAAVGFVGILIDRWNGWAVWSCTRDVAEAVVADQEHARAAYRAERAADGLASTDLDTAVNETIPVLRFDGDTIVLDDPGRDEPLRFAPDDAGEYVICGWMWTWRCIDPADCRQIIGTIPADGEHQRWVQLPHTDLRVPHDRLRVTTLDELERPNGVAFTATLSLDGLNVGTIENDGNGEQTWLRSPNTVFGWRRMADYTAGCRRHGRPVTEAQILDALVDEYDTDRLVRTTTMAGRTVLRDRDRDGHTTHLTAVDDLFPRHAREAGRILARYLTAHPDLSRTGWHLWTGDRWAPIAAPRNLDPQA